jgi:hypothetical protein
MLDFLKPEQRKAIYQIIAFLNATAVAMVPVLQQFGIVTDDVAAQVVQFAAGVLSVAGFLLASKNVDVAVKPAYTSSKPAPAAPTQITVMANSKKVQTGQDAIVKDAPQGALVLDEKK